MAASLPALLLPPLVLLLHLAAAAGPPPTYRAAVLEFSPPHQPQPNPFPLSHHEASKLMLNNIDALQHHIISASSHSSHILILPEYGLTGSFFSSRAHAASFAQPLPAALLSSQHPVSLSSAPASCDHASFPSLASPSRSVKLADGRSVAVPSVVQRLACLALSWRLVLVVNVLSTPVDAAVLQGASVDEVSVYNSELVFEVDGSLRVVYHKYRLFQGENEWADAAPPPATLDDVRGRMFNTSFGVEFAMEICFDVQWPEPQLLWPDRVQNVIFSTAWWTSAPFMTSNPNIQAVSATRRCRNYLVANIGRGQSRSGSGLFTCGASAPEHHTVHAHHAEATLIIGDLPRAPQRQARLGSPDTTREQFPFYWPSCSANEAAQREAFLQDARSQGNPVSRLPAGTKHYAYLSISPGASYDVVAATGSTVCRLQVAVNANSPSREGLAELYALIAYEGESGAGWNTTTCIVQRCEADDPMRCAGAFWVDRSLTRVDSLVLTAELYMPGLEERFELDGDEYLLEPRGMSVGSDLSVHSADQLSVQYAADMTQELRIQATDADTNGVSILASSLYSFVWHKPRAVCETEDDAPVGRAARRSLLQLATAHLPFVPAEAYEQPSLLQVYGPPEDTEISLPMSLGPEIVRARRRLSAPEVESNTANAVHMTVQFVRDPSLFKQIEDADLDDLSERLRQMGATLRRIVSASLCVPASWITDLQVRADPADERTLTATWLFVVEHVARSANAADPAHRVPAHCSERPAWFVPHSRPYTPMGMARAFASQYSRAWSPLRLRLARARLVASRRIPVEAVTMQVCRGGDGPSRFEYALGSCPPSLQPMPNAAEAASSSPTSLVDALLSGRERRRRIDTTAPYTTSRKRRGSGDQSKTEALQWVAAILSIALMIGMASVIGWRHPAAEPLSAEEVDLRGAPDLCTHYKSGDTKHARMDFDGLGVPEEEQSLLDCCHRDRARIAPAVELDEPTEGGSSVHYHAF